MYVGLTIEMESQQKKAELDKKAYDDLLRERDVLSKVSTFLWVKGLQCSSLRPYKMWYNFIFSVGST